MSFVRRVKSFSAMKKSKSGDILKRINEETPMRVKSPQLHRQKSMSVEYVPGVFSELKQNELFKRQRNKLDEEVVEEQRKAQTRKKQVRNLEKRKSASLDSASFLQCIPRSSVDNSNAYGEVQVRQLTPRKSSRDISRYRTIDVTRDLIDEFKERFDDEVDTSNRPQHFPVDNEFGQEVEVRSRPSGGQLPRPKTFSSSSTKRKEDPFEARGPFRLEIINDKCTKVKSSEKLKLYDGILQVYSLTNNAPVELKENVELRKGTKLTGKRDVEMTDTRNTTYIFHFDSSKDAKQFIEMERTRSLSLNEKTSIKSRLLKLLGKRSSRDLLESKGIIQNEPIFGNILQNFSGIPEFVVKIVELIEEPENIRSVGLYRTSPNLAVVQKIRFEVDCGRLEILEFYERDVDVLTGSLKLFFRELKESLIPYDVYQRLQKIIENQSSNRNEIYNIIDKLPKQNKETLIFILTHLLKVCEHKDENKMDIHNISVSWGPSLIAIPDNCSDLVVQTTQFYKVTEYLLNFFQSELGETPKKVNNIKTLQVVDPVYVITRKLTELIEYNITVEGIYRKSGSNAKIKEILRKLKENKLDELEKLKSDVHDLCCALKNFLYSLQEPLIPAEMFEQFCVDCDKLSNRSIEENIRKNLESIPHKEALILLLGHLQRVLSHENKNKMSLIVLTDIWTTTLMNPTDQKRKDKKMKFCKFFESLVTLKNNLPDVLPKFEAMRALRESRYDNLCDDIEDVRGEADILDDKTETKL